MKAILRRALRAYRRWLPVVRELVIRPARSQNVQGRDRHAAALSHLPNRVLSRSGHGTERT